MSSFNISINGGSVGAMAIGHGARASGNIGGDTEPVGKMSVSVEIMGATQEQASEWLRAARMAVNRGEAANVADNTAQNGAKLAYSIKVG